MYIGRKISVSIMVVIVIFVIGLLLGAALLSGYVGTMTPEESVPDKVSVPEWISGQFWVYNFETPEVSEASSRIVVADNDGTNYQVGVSSRMEARRHGVLNYNPVLGRVTMGNLSIYEKGIAQPLFDFPLKKGSQWTFCMFDREGFKANVVGIRKADLPVTGFTYMVEIEAVNPDGVVLTYSYDTDAEWIRSMILKDSSGNPLLQMTLVSYGKGFSGEVFFVRGSDLFAQDYSSPALDVYNTFVDQGHPEWGDFDYLIYYYDVTTGDGSAGTLAIRDPTPTATDFTYKAFGPSTIEQTLGTIPSESGEWSVSVTLTGSSHLSLKIAGGLEYSWSVA